MKDRSRAPIRHGLARDEELVAAALALRERHPTWGPKKLRRKLAERSPEIAPPARSTISERLRQEGLTLARRARRRCPRFSSPFLRPERIDPGKPTQNGRHERMRRTLKEDAADPPAATLAEQQRRFDAFRAVYNHQRPYEALGFATPAALL